MSTNVDDVIYRPASANFFSKTGGQFQFVVGSPTWKNPEDSNGKSISWVYKQGAVFVEAAPPDPNNPGRLDWKNKKIVLALSDKDIGEILYGIRVNKPSNSGELVKIFHSNDDRTVVKTFKILQGRDETWALSLHAKAPGVDTKVHVYIKGPDLMRLTTLLQSALPVVLGWDKA